MASTTTKVVLVQVNSESGSRPIHDKDPAAVTVIRPGQLLEMNTSEQIIVHASANGPARPTRISVENPYGSDPTVAAIETNYAIADNVRYIYPQAGDLCNMLIEASAVLVKGVTMLASAGDGSLQAIVPDASTVEGSIVARAEADVTIGGSAARSLVRMV